MSVEDPDDPPIVWRPARLAGLAAGGCIVAGVGGFAFALLGVALGRYEAAGFSLIAAAVACGLLANALLRK